MGQLYVFATAAIGRSLSGDKMKVNEMSEACSMFGREEECIQGFDKEI